MSSGTIAALEAFAASPSPATYQIEFNEIIRSIAQTGESGLYDWQLLRQLLAYKLNEVILEFEANAKDFSGSETDKATFQRQKDLITTLVLSFKAPPFTLQRLCEIISNTNKNYKRTPKLLRGLEKLVLVNTTQPVSQVLGKMSVTFANGFFTASVNNSPGSAPSSISSFYTFNRAQENGENTSPSNQLAGGSSSSSSSDSNSDGNHGDQ